MARWFFRVGGAAGPSRSDVGVRHDLHDAIYGQSDRYVSRQRLETMLSSRVRAAHRTSQQQRASRPGSSSRRHGGYAQLLAQGNGHGWLGIRFQPRPSGRVGDHHSRPAPSGETEQQQRRSHHRVNLVYGALFQHADPTALIASLLDNVDVRAWRDRHDRVQRACLRRRRQSAHEPRSYLGPHARRDVRCRRGVIQPSDALYRSASSSNAAASAGHKHITVDMLRVRQAQFVHEPGVTARTRGALRK